MPKARGPHYNYYVRNTSDTLKMRPNLPAIGHSIYVVLGTHTVQTSYNLNGTRVCSRANACVCMFHTLQHAPPILLLQTYSHYP